MLTTETNAHAPRRRRIALSLRVLMLLIVGIGLLLGWKVNRVRTQSRAAARIKALGGQVGYDYEFSGTYPVKTGGKPWGPDWLRRRIGDDYFREVTFVRFYRQVVTDAYLEPLADLDSLLAVELHQTRQVTDAGLVHLRRLNRLRHVKLVKTGVTAAGLARLAALPRLETLWFNGEPVTDGALASIGSMRRLRVLHLSNLRASVTGMAHLKALTELSELSIDSHKLNDATIVPLASLRRLRKLDLPMTRITDAGLAQLRDLRELESLGLTSVVDLTDAGLETVGRFQKLKLLKLGGTEVTDAGLHHLQHLTALETLDLSADTITDAGLAALESLPRLRVVFLDRTAVSPEAVARWQSRNPSLFVSNQKGLLAGGIPAWQIKSWEKNEKEWDDYAIVMKDYRKTVESGAPHGPIPPPPGMRSAGPELRRVPGVRVLGFLLGR